MINFAKRNLRLFFRDKAAVLLSFLTAFIIIGLYVLFLGESLISGLSELSNAREVADNWVMAGLLSTISVSTSFSAFSIMVSDRAFNIRKDFYSSPISRRSLAGGYVLSAFVIALAMSLLTIIPAEAIIAARGGALMSAATVIKVVSAIVPIAVCNTSMMFFISSFFSSTGALSTAGTIIGTLIGFLTGIYLPIGTLPESVQWIIKLFPTSHGAAMLRILMMEESMKGIPSQFAAELKPLLGVTYKFGDTETGFLANTVVVMVCAAVFFGLAVINISRKSSGRR